jgi:hypothetical protein
VKNNQRLPWGWIITLGVGSKVLLTLAAFIWVAFYSTIINPGHDAAYYERYAQTASPYVSIVGGIPLFFALAWWLGRRNEHRAITSAILLWVINVVLDLPLLIFFDFSEIWVAETIANSTRLIAAYSGALVARRKTLEQTAEGH